jgi:hypothetical protein
VVLKFLVYSSQLCGAEVTWQLDPSVHDLSPDPSYIHTVSGAGMELGVRGCRGHRGVPVHLADPATEEDIGRYFGPEIIGAGTVAPSKLKATSACSRRDVDDL